ncbi:MAG: hypothetical protein ABIR80_19635, partial [Opitutaceae bacterium]
QVPVYDGRPASKSGGYTIRRKRRGFHGLGDEGKGLPASGGFTRHGRMLRMWVNSASASRACLRAIIDCPSRAPLRVTVAEIGTHVAAFGIPYFS